MACRVSVEGAVSKALGINRAAIARAARLFAEMSSRRVKVPFREVAVILQDDQGSAEAHEAIMGVGGATDVITQGYEAIPPEPDGIYGELYVNADMAVRAAPSRRGWSAAKELLLYVAHGMDHLSGADDHSPEGYSKMRRRELRWIRRV